MGITAFTERGVKRVLVSDINRSAIRKLIACDINNQASILKPCV